MHANILEWCLARQGILVKHGDIRPLAWLQTADAVIQAEGIGSAQGNGFQCPGAADLLGIAERCTASGLSCRGTPCREQRREGSDRCIAMNTEGNAQAIRTGGRLQSLAPVETQRSRQMDIAPVIDMVGKDVQADTEPRGTS